MPPGLSSDLPEVLKSVRTRPLLVMRLRDRPAGSEKPEDIDLRKAERLDERRRVGRHFLSTEADTVPVVLEMPALLNRITSRVAARPSVTSRSRWSIVPVKCMLKTSGAPPGLPKRR